MRGHHQDKKKRRFHRHSPDQYEPSDSYGDDSGELEEVAALIVASDDNEGKESDTKELSYALSNPGWRRVLDILTSIVQDDTKQVSNEEAREDLIERAAYMLKEMVEKERNMETQVSHLQDIVAAAKEKENNLGLILEKKTREEEEEEQKLLRKEERLREKVRQLKELMARGKENERKERILERIIEREKERESESRTRLMQRQRQLRREAATTEVRMRSQAKVDPNNKTACAEKAVVKEQEPEHQHQVVFEAKSNHSKDAAVQVVDALINQAKMNKNAANDDMGAVDKLEGETESMEHDVIVGQDRQEDRASNRHHSATWKKLLDRLKVLRIGSDSLESGEDIDFKRQQLRDLIYAAEKKARLKKLLHEDNEETLDEEKESIGRVYKVDQRSQDEELTNDATAARDIKVTLISMQLPQSRTLMTTLQVKGANPDMDDIFIAPNQAHKGLLERINLLEEDNASGKLCSSRQVEEIRGLPHNFSSLKKVSMTRH